jgi:hypoxanthine phosphoribosyltransferase
MSEPRSLAWYDIEKQCGCIADQVRERCSDRDHTTQHVVDAIIGLSRGGLVPATIIAHQLHVREVLVHGYHSYDDETNRRDPDNMHGVMYQDVVYDLMKGLHGKNILIVDDLCDEGITMHGLTRRLYKKFHKGAVNFLTAALYCKTHSQFRPDFVGEDCGADWLVFPWEEGKYC